MARFDVFQNPDASERRQIPFMLDVQNDFLDGLETRVVVPLWHTHAYTRMVRRLNPELTVSGKQVVMDSAAIGALPIEALRRPVDNISAQQLAIQDALDTLFGGY